MPAEPLVDITALALGEHPERTDNIRHFLDHIGNHKRFEVKGNIVNLQFAKTTKTLTSSLRASIEKR